MSILVDCGNLSDIPIIDQVVTVALSVYRTCWTVYRYRVVVVGGDHH